METNATAGFAQAADTGQSVSQTTQSPSLTAPSAGDATYLVAEGQKELDCKKLTGRIQIRLLELRTYVAGRNTSTLSRSLQTAGKTILGGTLAGVDPEGEHAKEMAEVEAYNRELVAHDCRSFDIAKELVATGTPAPTILPPSKAAGAAAPVPVKPR